MKRARRFPDIGERFGHLVVNGTPQVNKKIRREIVCKCDCGKYKHIDMSALLLGKVISCGCVRNKKASERAVIRNTTHGLVNTAAYRTWSSMKARCLRKSHDAYDDYGGRGIKICERWMDFATFLADMGPRPKGTTIDRIDPNGDYEPGNCRWATSFVQTRNRRNNVLITHNGVTLNASDWQKITGLPIFSRLKSGKSGDELFAPLGRTSKYYRKPLELYEAACVALQEHYDKMGKEAA